MNQFCLLLVLFCMKYCVACFLCNEVYIFLLQLHFNAIWSRQYANLVQLEISGNVSA